jgi:hypothetical protein
MLHSEDDEMVTLARRLFWMNNPSIEDYEYLQRYPWRNSEESWTKHKEYILRNINEQT